MKDLIEELQQRRTASLELGGKKRVARQHDQGKLTARERADLLFDSNTLEELGQLATHVHTPVTTIPDKNTPADGVITGFGKIEGRPAAVIAEDFTVLGGSLGINNFRKKCRMIELAQRDKLPIVWLFDGAGARTDEFIGEGLAPMHHFMAVARLSGVTPQVAGVLGPTAGDSSLLAAMMEFIVMVEGTAMLAAGGPPLVKVATGEDVTKEELGGADLHCRISGVGDNKATDDHAAITQIRRYLSYMPTNAYQYPPYVAPDDSTDRCDDELAGILPANRRRPYDMMKIIERVVDRGSFFAIKPDYAKMMITGLARLNGHAVGIIANQPKVMAGAITAAAGAKHRHFMDLCNAFHLPVVFLMDTPGVMTGPQSEKEGALRAGMAIAHSFAFARVPLLCLTVHKGFGYGAAAMGGLGGGQSTALAWPSADFNAIPLDSGIQAAYRAVLAAAADPATEQARLEAELGALCGAFPSAEQFKIDDIIEPRETRPRLILALERALSQRAQAPVPATRSGVLP
jgi:acetyl-CoA carboxylase carboxyltransferase component